ncbi:MAG: hypothetical protein F6K10_33170 [Moorea sp. SIO2B7]|nr:hypothetical protein [Moorena sp. SIO2B7]
MFGLDGTGQLLFEQKWQGKLSEYVTAVAWSSQGVLAASSGAGELVLWVGDYLHPLMEVTEQSIDCLAFSRDGQFLATGGQDGRVRIWHLQPQFQLISILENSPQWIDKLSWSPSHNQLAFSVGRNVQIWDASSQELVTSLSFESSSPLGIDWSPDGQYLAIAGNQGAKVWNTHNWEDQPYVLKMPTASVAIAWSPDGKYLACGNLERTLTVWQWYNPHPWIMRGFPGKVRNLAWSIPVKENASLLATSSAQGIAVWKKQAGDNSGWEAEVLDLHEGVVEAIAFQPGSFLLASAADDGYVCLWQNARQVGQILEGAVGGFSCLAWHPNGDQLAAVGQNGELIIWSIRNAYVL